MAICGRILKVTPCLTYSQVSNPWSKAHTPKVWQSHVIHDDPVFKARLHHRLPDHEVQNHHLIQLTLTGPT